MRDSHIKRLAVFLSFFLLLSLAACSGAPIPGGSSSQPDRLVVGIAQDFDTLDPIMAAAAGTKEVIYNIFHGLVNTTPGGEIIAELASDFSISADMTVYTFELRGDAKFHDGSTLTADDVVYTFMRAAGRTDDRDIPLNDAIDGAMESVAADGQSRVIFTLTKPDAAFLSMCMLPVIPAGSGESQATRPVGAGPYAFVSYYPGVRLELERFEDYYGAKPQFSEAEFRIFTNANAGLMALQNGEIHMMSFADTTLSYDETTLKLVKLPQNMVHLLAFNHGFEPFADIRVRQALSCATDRQMIIEMLNPDSPQIDTNMCPVMSYYYNDELTDYYQFDADKAKALLSEAGYGGDNPLRFSVKVPVEYQFHVDTAQIMKQQFEAVGVFMEIETVEWNTWLSEVYEGRDFEATIIGLAGKADPGEVLQQHASDFYRNFTNYNNTAFDTALDEAAATPNIGDRAALYKEAQRILTEDAAHIYIMDPCNNMLMDKMIGGYVIYPVPYIDLRPIVYNVSAENMGTGIADLGDVSTNE